jgi:hypothetical protein
MIRILLAWGALAAPAGAQLTLKEEPRAFVVESTSAPTWKARVDLDQGGVVNALHLPAGGPNTVFDRGGFSGLFNLFACDRREGHPAAGKGGAVAKTMVKHMGRVESARVLRRTGERIEIEVRGSASGWRLLGPEGEKVIEYRQTYAFRPDRIEVDGELRWVYGHGTRPADVSLLAYFAPGQVEWPARMSSEGTTPQELQVLISDGEALPKGIRQPASAEVRLRNGHRLVWRVISLGGVLRDCPWYLYERPWQNKWSQNLGWAGAESKQCRSRQSPGEPILYRYALEIPSGPSAVRAPRVRITGPAQREHPGDPEGHDSGLFFAPGETIRFRGSGSAGIQWQVYRGWDTPAAQGTGPEFTFRVPADEKPSTFYWVRASAGSGGASGIDYRTFRIVEPGTARSH